LRATSSARKHSSQVAKRKRLKINALYVTTKVRISESKATFTPSAGVSYSLCRACVASELIEVFSPLAFGYNRRGIPNKRP
jgi:hypothetical protein